MFSPVAATSAIVQEPTGYVDTESKDDSPTGPANDVKLGEPCVRCNAMVGPEDRDVVSVTGVDPVNVEWHKVDVVVCMKCRPEIKDAPEDDDLYGNCLMCDEKLLDFTVPGLYFTLECGTCAHPMHAACTRDGMWVRRPGRGGTWEVHCEECVESHGLSACFGCHRLISEKNLQYADLCVACGPYPS